MVENHVGEGRGEPGLDRSHLPPALERIREWLPPTPLLRHPEWDEVLHRQVYLKLECLQLTGSFKVRGAANLLLSLTPEEREGGVVACSSGNHARAVAFMARRLGVAAHLVVPDWVDRSKLRAMEEEGARVERVAGGYDAAEDRALERARNEGLTLVHPFDDPRVVTGQGTLGMELLEQLPEDVEPGDVLVPLSGGGLAAGVGLALEGTPHRMVTVSADRAAVMHRSLQAGHPVELPEEPTLASALSGGIGRPNRVTFPLLRRLPALRLLVTEPAVEAAVAWAFRNLRLVVEGGGAVGLAALLGSNDAPGLPQALTDRAGPLVIVLSGGNLDPETLLRLVAGQGAPAEVPLRPAGC